MTRGNPQLLLEGQAIAAHATVVADSSCIEVIVGAAVCVWGSLYWGSQTPRFWHWPILLAHGHEAVPPEDVPTKLPELSCGTTGEEFRRGCEETGITVCERQREGLG